MRYKMTFLGLGVSNFAVLKNSYRNNPKDFFVSSVDQIAPEKLEFLHQRSIPFEEGGHSDQLLDTDLLMISPSVKPTNEIYRRAKQKKILIRTDIELFLETNSTAAYSIAITGTNGKTTTVELIHHILSLSKETYAVGNIGYSPVELINRDLSQAVLVFELSSYQIQHLNRNKKFFNLSGLTNITQDHLDWHGGFDAYVKAKMGILDISRETIFPEELSENATYKYGMGENLNCSINPSEKRLTLVDQDKKGFVDLAGLRLKGFHNMKNSALAAFCCFHYGIDEKQIEKGLSTFLSGEHRMEAFFKWEGRLFVNDSKSTNAHSLICAIQAFKDESCDILLLAGAKDKEDDYTVLGEVISQGVKKTYLCGESAQRLYRFIPPKTEKELFDQWPQAIEQCIKESIPGDVILFSPGGSSFDMFENYKKRGEFFKNTVKGLLNPL